MGNGIPHGKSRGGRVLNVFSDFSITFVFKVSFLNGDFFLKIILSLSLLMWKDGICLSRNNVSVSLKERVALVFDSYMDLESCICMIS